MNNYENEKSIIEVNENSFFYKIKRFFKSLFNNRERNMIKEQTSTNYNSDRKKFIGQLKEKNENDETKLLKLQIQFENGQLKEDQLTDEQREALNILYDIQIANLKKSNKIRKKRILQNKKVMLDNN